MVCNQSQPIFTTVITSALGVDERCLVVQAGFGEVGDEEFGVFHEGSAQKFGQATVWTARDRRAGKVARRYGQSGPALRGDGLASPTELRASATWSRGAIRSRSRARTTPAMAGRWRCGLRLARS